MNNSNFGFDCRDNSQNRRLQLIYQEQTEVEFIEKHHSKGESNCFLNEEHPIKKCNDKYDQMMEDEDVIDKLPFVESLRQEELKESKIRRVRKKKEEEVRIPTSPNSRTG